MQYNDNMCEVNFYCETEADTCEMIDFLHQMHIQWRSGDVPEAIDTIWKLKKDCISFKIDKRPVRLGYSSQLSDETISWTEYKERIGLLYQKVSLLDYLLKENTNET